MYQNGSGKGLAPDYIALQFTSQTRLVRGNATYIIVAVKQTNPCS